MTGPGRHKSNCFASAPMSPRSQKARETDSSGDRHSRVAAGPEQTQHRASAEDWKRGRVREEERRELTRAGENDALRAAAHPELPV
eukprot:1306028-Rhodomonas_salina.1